MCVGVGGGVYVCVSACVCACVYMCVCVCVCVGLCVYDTCCGGVEGYVRLVFGGCGRGGIGGFMLGCVWYSDCISSVLVWWLVMMCVVV